MEKKLFMNREWVFALVLAALLLLGSSAAWAERGVTDQEILVGNVSDQSGPIAYMGRGAVTGLKLYLDNVNDQGGAYGRKIKLLVEDDGYQSPRAVQAARKLVTRDGIFAMLCVLGSVQSNAMYPFLESRSVPLLFPGTQARELAVPPRKYLFLADPTYHEMGKVAIEYFVETMGMNTPKIACIYQDDTPGHEWLQGISIGAAHYGIEVVALSYRRGSVDFSSQITRCKSEGIEYVSFWGVIREPAMMLREAQRQQYQATWITSFAAMNNTTLELAGDALDYSNGLYGFGIVYDFEARSSVMVEYMEVAKKYGVPYDDFMHANGYLVGKIFVEGIMRAGKNLTVENLIAALETFDNYDPGIRPPLTFGPNLRDGARGIGLGKAVNGTWRSILPEGQWLYSSIKE